MDKPRAISHFLYYLEHHPALAGLESARVLLGHTADYEALTGAIAEQAGEHPRFRFSARRLDLESTAALTSAITDSDLYIFFYDSSTLPNPRPDGPEFVRALQAVMAQNWKKSLLFKDYGDYFYDTFSVTPQRIAGLNSHLIQRMSQATTLSFTDENGSRFETPLSSIKKWTDINGVGNFDLAPGEIATHSEEINGHVKFKGTFLSVAGLSGRGQVAPSESDTEHAIDTMVEAVRLGNFGRYAAYDVQGEPLAFS
jgi:hypothetical protein